MEIKNFSLTGLYPQFIRLFIQRTEAKEELEITGKYL